MGSSEMGYSAAALRKAHPRNPGVVIWLASLWALTGSPFGCQHSVMSGSLR
jgi:hypothetical protein